MLKNQSFFSDFSQGMRYGDETRYHLDDLPYLLSWPFVYILKKTRVSPNQIGLLSFLTGLVFLGGLLSGCAQTRHGLLSQVLGLRILLDCIDGQLARYSDQTSNLGALYDLVADFVFALLLFVTLAYILTTEYSIEPLRAGLICLLAFFSFVITATVHSYLVLLGESTDLPITEIKEMFFGDLPNDFPHDAAYKRKLIFFNQLFGMTWRPVSLMVSSLLKQRIPRKKIEVLLHLLSWIEYGMHLVVLWVIILTQSPLLYFLIFEIILLGLTILLLSPFLQKNGNGE